MIELAKLTQDVLQSLTILLNQSAKNLDIHKITQRITNVVIKWREVFEREADENNDVFEDTDCLVRRFLETEDDG